MAQALTNPYTPGQVPRIFAGRVAELSRIRDQVSRVATFGELGGPLLVFHAPRGLGKTSLLRTAQRQAAELGFVSVWVACSRDRPFLPELVRGVERALHRADLTLDSDEGKRWSARLERVSVELGVPGLKVTGDIHTGGEEAVASQLVERADRRARGPAARCGRPRPRPRRSRADRVHRRAARRVGRRPLHPAERAAEPRRRTRGQPAGGGHRRAAGDSGGDHPGGDVRRAQHVRAAGPAQRRRRAGRPHRTGRGARGDLGAGGVGAGDRRVPRPPLSPPAARQLGVGGGPAGEWRRGRRRPRAGRHPGGQGSARRDVPRPLGIGDSGREGLRPGDGEGRAPTT